MQAQHFRKSMTLEAMCRTDEDHLQVLDQLDSCLEEAGIQRAHLTEVCPMLKDACLLITCIYSQWPDLSACVSCCCKTKVRSETQLAQTVWPTSLVHTYSCGHSRHACATCVQAQAKCVH